jgi:protein-L-isoaspartate(D-aspartate) O-methyltransferase
MTQALEVEPHHRVLEIGTGSGYQAAVLGELAKEVYDRDRRAAGRARTRDACLAGYRNIQVRTGDGYQGWPEHAPRPHHGHCGARRGAQGPRRSTSHRRSHGHSGRQRAPGQELRILRRTTSGVETLDTLPVRFVPMVKKPK